MTAAGQPEPTRAHADDADAVRRMEEIRRRNAYLRDIPFETHGPGVHGDNCPPCGMVRSIGDVSWLLEQLDTARTPATTVHVPTVLPTNRAALRALYAELAAERDRARAELAKHKPGPKLHAVRLPDGHLTHGDADWCQREAANGVGEHVETAVCIHHTNWRPAGGDGG